MFEAAEKEVSDEAVGKKGSRGKGSDDDKAPDLGDMLSTFFGGGKK